MKYKNYGNYDNKKFDAGLGLEFLKKYDDISDRSINRPLINLNENQEEMYNIINNIMKSIHGNKNGIIPGIYEDFDAEGFIINSFSGDSNNFYIRIPTGSMILSKNIAFSKDYYNFGDKEYLDEFKDSKLLNDQFKSFVYTNRPNVNVLERQLANIIGLDLNDLENDIKVEAVEVPIAYPIYTLDQEEYPITSPNGNFKLIELDGKIIYKCNKENAEYYALEDSILNQKREVILANDPQGKESKNKVIDRLFIKETAEGTIPENIFTKITEESPAPEELGHLYFTTDINKAIKAIDYNGENKKRIGYTLKVTISTELGQETKYFPNKKENSSWEIYLPEKAETLNGGVYTIKIEDDLSEILNFTFTLKNKATAAEVNNAFYRALILNAEKVLKVSRENIKPSSSYINLVRLTNRLSDKKCDNYKLTITLDGQPVKNFSTKSEEVDITAITPNILYTEQEYYYNMFELVNDFSQRYKNNFTTKNNLSNYISGETILKLINNEKQVKNYHIYYDLNFDQENKDKENYDKSGRLFISENENELGNCLKLFTINITGKDKDVGRSKPKINSITNYLDKLDKRTIYSKKAELSSLSVSDRADIKEQFTVSSTTGRAIEINSPNLETVGEQSYQSRIYSPILRLSTTNETFKSSTTSVTKEDDPIDFTDDYTIKNLSDETTEKKFHTNNDTGIGLIFNENKGARLYSGRDKPIEIVSKTGDINVINTNGNKISLKNLQDPDSCSIDLLGITQIRSKNDNQLIINRKGSTDNTSASASIEFQKEGAKLGNIEFYKDTKDTAEHAKLNLLTDNIFDITKEITTITSNVDIQKTVKIDSSGANETENALSVKGKSNFVGDVSIGNANPSANRSKLSIVGDLDSNSKSIILHTPETKAKIEISAGTDSVETGIVNISSETTNISSSILNINTSEADASNINNIKGSILNINTTNGATIVNTNNTGNLLLGRATIKCDASGNVIFSWA